MEFKSAAILTVVHVQNFAFSVISVSDMVDNALLVDFVPGKCTNAEN